MKKILILTWSYWSWHNSAAKGLEKAIKNLWNEVEILDIVDFFDKNALKSWTKAKYFYEDFCSKYKKVWEITFNFLDDANIREFLYSFKYPFLQRKFDKYLKQNNFDFLINVFPFWQIFLKHYIKYNWKTFKTWVFITDSINIHSIRYLWDNLIDKYFFIDSETQKIFINKFKHKQKNLVTSFFPIDKEIFFDKKDIVIKNIVFLLTWQEKDFSINLLENFKNSDYNIIVLKWRNDILFKKIELKYKQIENIKLLDFYDIKTNLKTIDLIISKPGWAIISEAISNDIPFIISNFIAWQEQWNKEFIEKFELWFYENDANKIYFNIKYMDFSRMLPNFKEVKKSDSINIILKNIWIIEK